MDAAAAEDVAVLAVVQHVVVAVAEQPLRAPRDVEALLAAAHEVVPMQPQIHRHLHWTCHRIPML